MIQVFINVKGQLKLNWTKSKHDWCIYDCERPIEINMESLEPKLNMIQVFINVKGHFKSIWNPWETEQNMIYVYINIIDW